MIGILLRASLLFLLAASVTVVLRRRAASLRHLAWALSIGGVLCLPLISTFSPLRWEVIPVPTAAAVATASARSRPNAQKPVLPEVNAPVGVVEEPLAATDDAGAATAPRATLDDISPALASLDRGDVLFAVYLAGVAVLLGWLALGCAVIRRRASRATPVRDAEWTALIASVARDLGLTRAPELRVSVDVPVPFATGIARPMIVLPPSSHAWTSAQRRAVLLHEAAHISRGDLTMNLLSYVARAIYWINPLAWIAARRLRVEGEIACDDLVIAHGSRQSEYADHLLRVAQSSGRQLPTVALAMARGSEFEGRLLSILATDVPRHRVRRRQLASALAAAALAVVGVGIVSPTVQAATEETTPAPDVLSPPTLVPPDPADVGRQESAEANPRVRVNGASGNANAHIATRAETGAVGGLIALLSDSDASVRLTAARSLSNLHDPAAVAALAKALKEDTDARVREAAASALGEIHDTRAVPHLVEALRAERVSKVRTKIIEALQELDDPRATSAVVAALKDQSTEVRRAAVSALEELEDASAVAPLQALVRDPDTELRRRLASALGAFDDPSSLDAIITLTKDADAEVRAQAVEALDDIQDARVAPALVAALGDRNAQVRQHAADGLGNVEGLRTAPRALIDALGDANDDVRRSAANSLGSIGDEAAVPALKKLLASTNVETRREAAEALKEIGGAEAVESLLGLLKDSDAEIRRTAAEALGKRREQ